MPQIAAGWPTLGRIWAPGLYAGRDRRGGAFRDAWRATALQLSGLPALRHHRHFQGHWLRKTKPFPCWVRRSPTNLQGRAARARRFARPTGRSTTDMPERDQCSGTWRPPPLNAEPVLFGSGATIGDDGTDAKIRALATSCTWADPPWTDPPPVFGGRQP